MSFGEKSGGDDGNKERWQERLEALQVQRADMNKLIMNYLVTEGFKEAAEKFEAECGVRSSVALESLEARIRIRESVQAGRIQEAVGLVNGLHPELLDQDRYLFFHLQQQHLIELIRQRSLEAALQFAQEHLSERGEENPKVLQELERTLALLAFEEPENSPFADLLHPSHRQKVASELNAAILRYDNQEPTSPRLATLLKLILWAQDELERKKVRFPKMTDIGAASLEDPK